MKTKYILLITLFSFLINAEGSTQDDTAVATEERPSAFSCIASLLSNWRKPTCYKLKCECCRCLFPWDGATGSRKISCCCKASCVKCGER